MVNWNEKAPLLDAKLDPRHVTQRTQAGRTLDYIEGWWAIAEANRIFGHGEWSFQIVDLKPLSQDIIDGKYGKQWRVCYSCVATVNVGGVIKQDVGFGQGQAKPENIGDALESAGKEAVTDAMKRCFRQFGNPFGLALYDKTRANVGIELPQKPAEPPHDPETGEIADNRGEDDTDPPSVRAFIDQVRETLAMAGNVKPTRDELERGYAMAVVENIAKRKSSAKARQWFEIFCDRHGAAISRIQDEDLRRRVRSAIALKQAEINGEKADPADFGYPFGPPGDPIVLGEVPVPTGRV